MDVNHGDRPMGDIPYRPLPLVHGAHSWNVVLCYDDGDSHTYSYGPYLPQCQAIYSKYRVTIIVRPSVRNKGGGGGQ